MKLSTQLFALILLISSGTFFVANAEENNEVYPQQSSPKYGASSSHEGDDKVISDCCILYLRANLLRWATLTPDLGLEWRINSHWSILANGTYTSWSWNDKDRRYALWEIAPEIRCYLGKKRNWYVGAMYKAGSFNYKFSEIGKQGDIMGCGVTGGYILPLNKQFSLEFGLGLGYIHAKYDRYKLIDGVRVRQGKGNSNRYGPISAGVTLVWKSF